MCGETGLDLPGTDVHGIPSSGRQEHSRGKTEQWIMETLIQLMVRRRGPWERAIWVETVLWPVAGRNRMVAEGQLGCQCPCQGG